MYFEQFFDILYTDDDARAIDTQCCLKKKIFGAADRGGDELKIKSINN